MSDFQIPPTHLLNDGDGLRLSVMSQAQLHSMSKWAKWLALVGFVAAAAYLLQHLLGLFGLYSMTQGETATLTGPKKVVMDEDDWENLAYVSGAVIISMAGAALIILPSWWLLQFGKLVRQALALRDDAMLAQGLAFGKKALAMVVILLLAAVAIAGLFTLTGLLLPIFTEAPETPITPNP